ncbi:MAG: phage holin family protein [Cyanobacteria bacterium P01_F01_bin.116]
MIGFLFTMLLTALSLLMVDLIVPGVNIATFASALLAALSIGFVNGGIRPILSFLSFPITILTLGVFALVVNGFCFWLATLVVPGFSVHGLFAFFLAPIVFSVVSTLLNKYIAEKGLNFPLFQGSEDASLTPGE